MVQGSSEIRRPCVCERAPCAHHESTVSLCQHKHESGKANREWFLVVHVFLNAPSLQTHGWVLCLWFFLLCAEYRVSTAYTMYKLYTCTHAHTHSLTGMLALVREKSPHAIHANDERAMLRIRNGNAFVLVRQRRERANNLQWRVETTAPLYIKIICAGFRRRFTFTAYSLFMVFFPVCELAKQNKTLWSV